MTFEERVNQETRRSIELAAGIAALIPDETPASVGIAALTQVLSFAVAHAAEGDRERAFEMLAESNRAVEAMVIDHCSRLAARGEVRW